MKILIVLCTLAAAFAIPVEEHTISFWPEPSQRFNGRIINGENAAQNAAPFICSLQWGLINSFQHTCGGSILSQDWILTAAHCITELPNIGNMQAQCGVTHRTNDMATSQIIRYARADAIIHPLWVPGAVGQSDIALIRISGLTLTPTVQPVPQLNEYLTTGTARLFGWGAVDNNTPTPTIPLALQTVEKDILSYQECRNRFQQALPNMEVPLIQESNICAARGFTSACGGDSGGPLVVSRNGQWVQVGVVSWGLSPCGSAFEIPSAYARTESYLAWIQEHTGLALTVFTV